MPMRRKGVKRTERAFMYGNEVRVVEEYKYLWCVVNEYH